MIKNEYKVFTILNYRLYKMTNKIFSICVAITVITGFIQCQLCSQTPKRSITIHTGYSNGRADIRYDHLNYGTVFQEVETNVRNTTPDDEFFVGLAYNKEVKNKFRVGAGLNYAVLNQDFFLPIRTRYFCLYDTRPYFRTASTYHIIQLAPSADYTIVDRKVQLGVNLQYILNITFKKEFEGFESVSNKVEQFANEVYTGFYSQYKRIRMDIGVRALHLKYRDDALYVKEVYLDPYNPFKIRFQLSYAFWQK